MKDILFNELTPQQRTDIIVMIGNDRLRGVCSLCRRKSRFPERYHIQLCEKCRLENIDKMQEAIISRVKNRMVNIGEKYGIKRTN